MKFTVPMKFIFAVKFFTNADSLEEAEKVIGLSDEMINVINVLKSFRNEPPDTVGNIDHMVECISDEMSSEDKQKLLEIYHQSR